MAVGVPGRWCLKCSDAGEDCSLSFAGSYDDVVAEAAAHWRRAHGARGEETEIRDAVIELMRRDDEEWLTPPEPGDGAHASMRPDWPF